MARLNDEQRQRIMADFHIGKSQNDFKAGFNWLSLSFLGIEICERAFGSGVIVDLDGGSLCGLGVHRIHGLVDRLCACPEVLLVIAGRFHCLAHIFHRSGAEPVEAFDALIDLLVNGIHLVFTFCRKFCIYTG